MDNNPPDNNESKDKSKFEKFISAILSLLIALNKKIRKNFASIIVGILTGTGITIYQTKIALQSTSTSISEISSEIKSTNTLTATLSSMATSLSSANAKSDSQAIVHNNTFPLGSGNATIYHKFQNPVQACWYYAATYRTQHPYTVLWEEPSNVDTLKIRVVASEGVWKAHTCVKEKTDININKIEYLLRDGGTEENKVDKILQYLERNKTIDDSIEKIRKEIIRSISARITDNENQVESLLKMLLKKNRTEENKIEKILEEIRETPKEDEKIKIIRSEIEKRILKSISDSTDITDKDTNKIDVKIKIESLLPLELLNKLSDEKNKIDEILNKIPGNYTPIGTIRTEIAGNKNIFRIIQLITNPEPVVKLIGEETIVHRIEAEFSQNEDFKLIATTKATYNSAIHFDNDGSITHRRVKKADDYKCIILNQKLYDEIKNESYCSFQEKKQENNEHEYKNEIEIINKPNKSPIVSKEEEERESYIKAFKVYLEKRKKLHDDLTNDGCGAIPVEPDFVNDNEVTGELQMPSLFFLCHKNNKKSHVRIMVRENQQQKKEREDKAIQEEVKKREDEIRQEVKKETENKQSSEKQHKGSFLQKHFLLF